MKRKATMVYALLSILIASMAGTGFVGLVNANFEPSPSPPITDPPIIYLISPAANWSAKENETINVVFTVAMPKSWDWTIPNLAPNQSECIGTITSVNCSLDQTQIVNDSTSYGQRTEASSRGMRNLTYTRDVGSLGSEQLSLGHHNLTISVTACTLYHTVDSYALYDVSTKATYTFAVGAPSAVQNINPPNISDISIEQRARTEFQLTFSTNEPTSWMGYSLDTEANVTLTGNTTIDAGQTGYHTIIIYANGTAGNMAASDIVEFRLQINLPTPTSNPTPSPSLSPFVSSTLQPVTPINVEPVNLTNFYLAIAIIALALIGAILIILPKKRKK